MKNIENGITDRLKHLFTGSSVLMSQVNQNFHKQWSKLPDWLTFHMTPEAFITSKFVNNKYEYVLQQVCSMKRRRSSVRSTPPTLSRMPGTCRSASSGTMSSPGRISSTRDSSPLPSADLAPIRRRHYTIGSSHAEQSSLPVAS